MYFRISFSGLSSCPPASPSLGEIRQCIWQVLLALLSLFFFFSFFCFFSKDVMELYHTQRCHRACPSHQATNPHFQSVEAPRSADLRTISRLLPPHHLLFVRHK